MQFSKFGDRRYLGPETHGDRDAVFKFVGEGYTPRSRMPPHLRPLRKALPPSAGTITFRWPLNCQVDQEQRIGMRRGVRQHLINENHHHKH